MPIYAVPVPRYKLGVPLENDEIEYSVPQSLVVGVQATATLTLRVLSSSDKWNKLAPVTVAITVPRADYNSHSILPTGFPGITEVAEGTRSKAFQITEVAKGQTLIFNVAFTPQVAGSIGVAFTVKANGQIQRTLQFTILAEVAESPAGGP